MAVALGRRRDGRRHRAGLRAARAVRRAGGARGRLGQPGRRRPDLGDGLPDDGRRRLACAGPDRRPAEGAGRHAGGELAGQAVHDGGPGRAVLRARLRRADPAGRRAGLSRRADPAGRRALHGDGLRLVAADARRPDLHAGAGQRERRGDGLRLRADRRAAAGADRHRRAVGDAAAVGRALRRHPARRRAAGAHAAGAALAASRPSTRSRSA